MKTKYRIASFLLFSLVFVGCEDMDTLPQGDIVTPSQKEEVGKLDPSKLEARVNAVFAQFSQLMPNEGALGYTRHNDMGYPSVMLFTDTNGNDVISDDNGYNWTAKNLSYEDRSQTSLECQILWNSMYSMVYAANNVISGINMDTTVPIEQYYLAQGLGTRAFSYWVLAQLYQFNYKENEAKPCVPLLTDKNREEAASVGAPRASVKEVYEQMISDLTIAANLLEKAEKSKVVRKDKRYINLSVIYGLSARVNLSMHDYGAAASAATKAIEVAGKNGISPSTIEGAKKPMLMSANEKNWMWGIIVNETDPVVNSGIVNWPSHMGSFNYGYANFSGGKQINKDLYDKISDTDARKGWWIGSDLKSKNLTTAQQATITGYGYGAYTQVKFAPYNNVLKTSINASDIPLMRIEEMYLIKAEAESMSGKDGKTTLVDFIAKYRNDKYSFSNTTVQEEVLLQRRIEFWGEGLSWFDLMRLNKGVDRRGGGYPNATMVFHIAPTDPVLLWPIPEAELQANQALSMSDQNQAGKTPEPVKDEK